VSEAAVSIDDDSDADMWAEYESLPVDPPPAKTLNHGGPGVCRLCHPDGAPAQVIQQQGELQL
jgi:hypothetical protein